MRRRLVLGSRLALCVAISVHVSAQSANYDRILATYRAGEFETAERAFRAMPARERYRGAWGVVRASLHPFRRDVLQAVLALHTEGALDGPLGLCDATPESRRATPDVREQELLGSGYPLFEHNLLETLTTYSPDDEFLRSWYAAVIAYHDWGFPGERVCFENAPSRIRAHPEMQLALGAMHEKTWQQTEADGWFLPPSGQSSRTPSARFAGRCKPRPTSTRRACGSDMSSSSRKSRTKRWRRCARSVTIWTVVSPTCYGWWKARPTSSEEI